MLEVDDVSKSYRFLGVMIVTASIAYVASKAGASSWELGGIIAVANCGLQMMANTNVLRWSDDD